LPAFRSPRAAVSWRFDLISAAVGFVSLLLMTALSACIGLLPAAVSTGIGSQMQRPLATGVVGGMFLGPIILLIVVPAVQTLFFDRLRAITKSVVENKIWA
jgi:cobalt-zinc-cadmium resistance protein CzcA